MQMDWNNTENMLEKFHNDLNQSWEHLRAIPKHGILTDCISTEKKIKSAKFLTEAVERVKVLEVVHRRVMNVTKKLLSTWAWVLARQSLKMWVVFYCSVLETFLSA